MNCCPFWQVAASANIDEGSKAAVEAIDVKSVAVRVNARKAGDDSVPSLLFPSSSSKQLSEARMQSTPLLQSFSSQQGLPGSDSSAEHGKDKRAARQATIE